MAHKLLERVEAYYEAREVPFGKVYEWHPAHIALECECGEKVVCRIGSPIPGSTMPNCGQTNACETRLLIPTARPGATTMSRNMTTMGKLHAIL
jgi:hypothetical protein